MELRRPLLAILLLATALQAAGMARSPLPAQDGLKFIRIAREFGHLPLADVVRRADQHPLYPALIALAQPPIAVVLGDGPASWRIAAQVVSLLAFLLAVAGLHRYARHVAGDRAADLAALLLVLLPIPAKLGHDTLSDATALAGFAWGMAWGLDAVSMRRIKPAIAAGLATGLGYWARPEVALLPATLVVVAVAAGALGRFRSRVGEPRAAIRVGLAVALPFAALLGGYAATKGDLSEKLAVRRAADLDGPAEHDSEAARGLPAGLDDPRWDFAPKEEAADPGRLGLGAAVLLAVGSFFEAMAWVLPPLAVLGRSRRKTAGRIVVAYAAVFLAVVVRHAMTFGYLSSRHTLTLAIALLPCSADGALRLAMAIGDRLPEGRRHRLAVATIAGLIVASAMVQLKPSHPSRWGHAEAGRWLSDHAGRGDAVLDTRGWAAFVSGLAAYDPWHVGQALTDRRLAFVVVGKDELDAGTRRAETLRAVLDYAAAPAAAFPERKGGEGVGVLVYRYHAPESWEAIVR